MDKFDINITEQNHKRMKNRKTKLITIRKKNRTRISADDIKKISEGLQKQNAEKKIMIKCLTDYGYIQLKAFDEDNDIIADDIDYLGKEVSTGQKIYKATFYIQ